MTPTGNQALTWEAGQAAPHSGVSLSHCGVQLNWKVVPKARVGEDYRAPRAPLCARTLVEATQSGAAVAGCCRQAKADKPPQKNLV